MFHTLPEILKMQDGAPVQTTEDWKKRREEILTILRQEIYGFPPPVAAPAQGEVLNRNAQCCAGHAVLEEIQITVQTEKGPFSFPLKFFVPTSPGKHPLFLLINFRPDAYDRYFPAEEIIDHGFALAVLYYQDVTTDKKETWDRLAECFIRPTDGTGYGALTLWAWAASRSLDYLLTRPEVDEGHVGVIGHSRLGKTALWCAAQDERFQYAFSNDSGCAGAALEKIRHDGGETTKDIVRNFPYWFCENYQQYIDHPEKMPFDQHFLIGAIAPRKVCVGSASKDAWADPYSEQLSCVAASPVWKKLGMRGFIGPESQAMVGESFLDGDIGYHLREGVHFLSRQDWLQYMAFMKKHW